MSRKVIRSILPIAPAQYDQAYVDQLRRALDLFITEQRTPLVNFQGVPSSGAANTLELGDIYEDGGFLKIIRLNDVNSGSTVGTTAVGTVTVVTP
jgi:hypothetical protein